MPPVAILGAAAVGAAGTAYAANKAAKAQSAAANAQIANSNAQFNKQIELLDPFRDSGTNALGAYNYELGLGPQPGNYTGYTETPGYDFRLNEGLDAVNAGVGARHGLNSGASMKALNAYGQNYATNEYNNHLNRLAGQVNTGQASSAMQATAAGNNATNVNNALANQGNAQAAGYVGMGNALQGGINNAMGGWMYGKGQGLF